MSEQQPGGVPAESQPGYGVAEPTPGGVQLPGQAPVTAPVSPAAPQEGSTPDPRTGGADVASQGGLVGSKREETTADRRARLEQELADVQAEESAQATRDRENAKPEELCPTCGQLPPPAAPPEGHREIWCPDCGQKLADLPAGH